MELVCLNRHYYIQRLENEEWDEIFSIDYPGSYHAFLERMRAESCYWMPAKKAGQQMYHDLNALWEKYGIPFRLRSEPPTAPWGSDLKRLRLQPLKEWEESKKILSPGIAAKHAE